MTGASERFSDRLASALDRAPACVGLDPVVERLPARVQDAHPDPVEAIEAFCEGVIEAVAPAVGVVKAQSACFERYGGRGVEAMRRVLNAAHAYGLVTILDAKRGDIGISARHYASFAFEAMHADALTVNAYLGPDTLTPYLDVSKSLLPKGRGRGIFVLVRTSNPDSDAVQAQSLHDGATVAQRMARLVHDVGASSVGASGWSDVGAVVAVTKPDDAAELRRLMPHTPFLAPGFGAQGGTIDSLRPLFDDRGKGVVVNASRSVIYAFDESLPDWRSGVHAAAVELAEVTRSAADQSRSSTSSG